MASYNLQITDLTDEEGNLNGDVAFDYSTIQEKEGEGSYALGVVNMIKWLVETNRLGSVMSAYQFLTAPQASEEQATYAPTDETPAAEAGIGSP